MIIKLNQVLNLTKFCLRYSSQYIIIYDCKVHVIKRLGYVMRRKLLESVRTVMGMNAEERNKRGGPLKRWLNDIECNTSDGVCVIKKMCQKEVIKHGSQKVGE